MPCRRVLPGASRATASLILATALAACSSPLEGIVGHGQTGFEAALSRVADTASNRRQVMYDDTAEIVRLTGGHPAAAKGFGALFGMGAGFLGQMMPRLSGDTGLNLLKADYAVTAGYPGQILTLFDGGQDAPLVTSHLTKLGWKRSGGMLARPGPLDHTGSSAVLYEINMPRVRLSGSDVAVGSSRADLGQVGSPSGQTLASDPLVGALAGCLGDVVAAEILSGEYLGGKNPAAVAIGVRMPASGAATPRAVVCVSWSSDAEANRYATSLRKDLASGFDYFVNKPFPDLLPDSSVTVVGGSQHVVEWQASSPGNADLVFQMLVNISLPALPDCRLIAERMPRSLHIKLNGC